MFALYHCTQRKETLVANRRTLNEANGEKTLTQSRIPFSTAQASPVSTLDVKHLLCLQQAGFCEYIWNVFDSLRSCFFTFSKHGNLEQLLLQIVQ